MNKIFLILFSSLSFYNAIGQRTTCRDVLAVAESFMIDGNYENVRKVLNNTRATCSSEVSWFYIQFGYHTGIGNNDSALYYMNFAAKKFPNEDSILYLHAISYGLQYDSAMAVKGLEEINKAAAIKSKLIYLICASQLLRMSNRPAEALELISNAKKIEKNYDAQLEWGIALKDNRKFKEALSKFNKAIALNKFNPAAYLEKAELLLSEMNNQDAALAALDTVESIDSTLADPSLLRASFFESKQDYDNAIAEYDQAIQTDSSVHQVYLLRGNCLIEVGEYDLAEKDINKYKTLHPAESDVNYLLADLYLAKGDFNGAAILMSKMETNGESTYDLYLRRGMAYAANRQNDDALKDFNKAETFPEPTTELYFERGKCYFQIKEYRKAKYDFEKAKSWEADVMEFHYWHCKAAYEAGLKDEACASCKIAKFHGYEPIDKIYLKDCK